MKKALILMNMGGPRNLDEVKVFLYNMFHDPHILALPYPIRTLLARLILFFRTKKAQSHYQSIGSKSPLYDISLQLAQKMENTLHYPVFVQMRYTPPFSQEVIKQLKQQKIDEVVLLPLYPQYSTTTTLSSVEEFQDSLKKNNFSPRISIIEPFFKNSAYLNLIVDTIEKETSSCESYDLVFSAHGLPQKVINQGDPYQYQLKIQLFYLRKALLQRGILFRKTHLAYQSRVGPMKWLTPSLDTKLQHIICENDKVIIYPLSFTIANLETVYELDLEYKEIAEELGFKKYQTISLPNESDYFVRVLSDLVEAKA